MTTFEDAFISVVFSCVCHLSRNSHLLRDYDSIAKVTCQVIFSNFFRKNYCITSDFMLEYIKEARKSAYFRRKERDF